MSEKMQMEKRQEGFENLNFFNLAKKYWREQVLFYILTNLSCVVGLLVDQNSREIFLHKKQKIIFFKKVWDFSENFQRSRKKYIGLLTLGVFSYFLIVFAHVWFALHLEAKVRKHLKQLVIQKMFKLEGFHDKQKVSSILNYSVRLFSENVFYIPNQLYYAIVEILLVVFERFLIEKEEKKNFKSISSIRIFFSWYLPLFFFACVVSQSLLYYLEFSYHKSVENEIKDELFLIENRNLIIKKNEFPEFLMVYNRSLDSIFHSAVARNLSETFSFVFPSYFLVKLFPFLCVYCSGDLTDSVVASIDSFTRVFSNIRKVVERGRDFPFYYSSARKINDFLAESERDDKQKGQIISDHIQSIEFKDVTFAYQSEGGESRKEVLSNFSILFEVGKINEMNFPNGFGKSTVINLVMGMLKTQRGQILVNRSYNLGDIDIDWWRSSVSYSEHRNLIPRLDLSTGQKQLIDLNNAFENEKKQVFIFDEADSNLDHKNRNEFLNKLGELSIRKLVILVSHHSQK